MKIFLFLITFASLVIIPFRHAQADRDEVVRNADTIIGDFDKDGAPEMLPEDHRIIGDLNNYGIPELLYRRESDVRTTIEVREDIMVWDAGKKGFAESGIFSYSWRDTNCPGQDEPEETLSIDRTTKPYPTIVLERKVLRVARACEGRETVSSAVDRYQWSPLFRAYVTSLTALGNGLFSALEAAGRQEHKLLFVRNGSVRRLKNVFAVGTQLSGFELKTGALYFRASDAEWETDYAWQVEPDRLHFRAKNKKTGTVVYSKRSSVNPFK